MNFFTFDVVTSSFWPNEMEVWLFCNMTVLLFRGGLESNEIES